MISKIISGGQTGIDQGALFAAYDVSTNTGGTAPSNYHTDEGPMREILRGFGLDEGGSYRERTIKNIQDSDGTLLLGVDLNSPGSKLTRNEAMNMGKPFIQFDLNCLLVSEAEGSIDLGAVQEIARQIILWAREHNIKTLNVAGNRELFPDRLIFTLGKTVVKEVLIMQREKPIRTTTVFI